MAYTPSAPSWHGCPSWCHTQASFDELAFLRLWQAWRTDPQRPRHLHVVAHSNAPLESPGPMTPLAPELQALVVQLAAQSWGLLPGLHRLRFEAGHVTLTLCVGPHADWPEFAHVLRTHASGPCHTPPDTAALPTRSVTVIGAGIAGAGTARALAERGWQVTVLDAAAAPAAGASGLPVGVVAPHTSHDDSGVSRLSRAGLRLMRHTMQTLLVQGEDWGDSGVREHRLPGKTRRGGVPLSWLGEHHPDIAHVAAAADWTQTEPRDIHAKNRASSDTPHWYWHPRGAWLRPAQLVKALLNHPNIRWQGLTAVDALRCTQAKPHTPHTAPMWQVLQGDTVLAESARVVVAAGPQSAQLIATATHDASGPALNPLRGQVSWGWMADVPANTVLPPTPVNGHGSFVHSVPTPGGPAWFAGATYDRGNTQALVLDADHTQNLERLRALAPETAVGLSPLFTPLFASLSTNQTAPRVYGWAGVRCGVHDRLPMVGCVWNAPAGLYMNTAMGSRGLTLALLCGELLAAQWEGEPLAIEAQLAKFLDATRFEPKP